MKRTVMLISKRIIAIITVIFGIRINKLENAVFFGDSGLKTIKFKSDKNTSFGRKAFRGVKRNVDILIPVAMAKKYSGMIKKAK